MKFCFSGIGYWGLHEDVKYLYENTWVAMKFAERSAFWEIFSHQRHIKERFHHQDPWICLIWVGIQVSIDLPNALQETTISHLGKRDIMFEHTLGGDMLGGNIHAYMQFFWTLNISLFGSMRKHANSQKRASHISGIEQCLAAPPSQAPWRRKVRFHLGNNALFVLKFAPWFSKGQGGTAMFCSCFLADLDWYIM